MKKRLLSALLALALVFVLLPTTALAETPAQNADIYIAGTGWNFEKDGSTYQTVYYQIQSGTGVFLKEFGNEFGKVWTTDPYLEITRVENDVTITVHGKMEISSNESCIQSVKSYSNAINLIITGTKNDTLTLTNSSIGDAIYSHNGDVTIKDGITVNACSTYFTESAFRNARGICVYGHDLIISGANTTVNVESKAAYPTVKVDGTITVSGGAQLNATNKYYGSNNIDKAYAIECGGLSISGNNTKVTAKTSNGDKAISGTVNNGDKLTFKVQINVVVDKLYQRPMSEALEYKNVEITQAPTTTDVYIAGEQAIVGQETPIPGGTGTYLYEETLYDGSSLTLKGATINKTSNNDTNAIKFTAAGTYTVNLEGTNKISNVSTGILAANVQNDAINVIISGSGSLDITAKGRAIEVPKGYLTFNNTGTINLKTTNTADDKINAIKVSGEISIGSDFNKNLRITAGNDTFDLKYSNFNDLNKYKSITIASKPSETYYNGTAMKYGATRDAGNGTISCDENGVITLNGVTEGTLEFRSSADSTLVLEGTNTLSSIVTTQKGLTISGSGSLTVGSIRVPNNTQHTANLTITGGAHVTVNRPSEDKPAVEVSGNLTVTGDGTQLSAECTAATNPAIEVGGNVTISGNPGTNAYTVKAYNKYATQRDRDDNLRHSQMPSAFEISGNLSISGSAQVMAQTDSDGAAVWMPKEKVISVVDASLIAQNSSHNFSTISFGDGSDMGNIYAKGQEVNIVAENMLGSSSRLAHRAIKAFIYNNYNTGDSNPYYINVVSEGVHSGGNVNVIPGHPTSTGGYKVTITRGDAYTTPQVAANYTIAGQTMYVGKYYKTDANGNITDGTAQDYNIYCDSENDFTLNNATISSTGTDVAINTNIRYETNIQHHIKLIGTNRINNTFKHAISGGSRSSTIIIEGVGNASDASLTINGNFLPIYSDGKVIINAEVVIVNTTDDNSFKGLISTSDGKGAFDLGSGYKCYASTSTTGTPLEEFNSANYSTYKYLRVTTQTLETGGGSTHQHTSETGWETDGTNHWKTCSTCSQKYDEGACTISGYNNDNGASGYHKVLCSVGHVMKTELHDYEYKITLDGTMHYKECKICHYTTLPVSHNFGSSGTETCECGAIPSHTHNLSGQRGHDDTNHWDICSECSQHVNEALHTYGDWITDTPATDTTDGSKHRTCSVCQYQENATIPKTGTGEIVPPTPENPGTIVIIRPAEEEKPAQQPNPSTGANDLVGMAVAAAVVAVLGSVALLRKHD